MPLDRPSLISALKNVATRLRIDSIKSTSEAGSGHPTSCCSAADLVAALFFAEMRFDPKDPKWNPLQRHSGSRKFWRSSALADLLLGSVQSHAFSPTTEFAAA